MKPKISFVLPTFNRIAWLSECITSLRNQTLKEVEIVVIDDCSTDSTEKLMKWFCEQDKRIVYVRNEQNLGAALSRNKGNRLATADIICVTDSDDFYPLDRAEVTLNYFKKHDNVDMVNGSYYRVDYSSNIVKEFPASQFDAKTFVKGEDSYFCHPSAAYRRKDILAIPYRKEETGRTDDHQMVSDWVKAGKKIRAMKNVLCFHRVLPGSIMTCLRGGSLE